MFVICNNLDFGKYRKANTQLSSAKKSFLRVYLNDSNNFSRPDARRIKKRLLTIFYYFCIRA